ncbi:putative COP9 subunit 3 [Aspergillus chevalieri]|uniref:COP9 signalosome complex subunit 3 N-terminal helical repeats domain-containing protein n=1 Tax=Aspergillus chevalieri TaxID=182096 RepID=A0A7R7VQR8_ASPCH|nr:uncharacterized protein ACHE_50279A [Aspergillus chevalieri]BCR89081.1 hypothetical protein ACHE_50279A [Aspergillus chevalieri]
MAEVLSQICSLSSQLHYSNDIADQDYDNQTYDLLAQLRQIIPTASNIISGEFYFLDNLEPSLHTLPYLLIWGHHVCSIRNESGNPFPEAVRPGGKLWSKAVHFLMGFDPIQVRYAGSEWRELVELVGQSAFAVSKPFLAIQPIREAIFRLDPSCSLFTSSHLLLVKLCLHARAYRHALPILNKPICHFPAGPEQNQSENQQPILRARHESSAQFVKNSSGLSAKVTYREHLEYFLNGAMIYMVLKQWKKALHFLTIVISSPVINSVSMVMVEAYKKWILVSLLDNGKLVQTPAAISSHTIKIYRSITKPYVTLAGVFESGDFSRLEAEVEIARPIWHTDGNTGLVLQVVGAFEKFRYRKLGGTFAALTISDAVQRAPSRSGRSTNAEQFIAALIMSKTVNANLSHPNDLEKSTMLRFSNLGSSASALEDSLMRSRLVEDSWSLANLMGHVEEGDYVLGMSKEYIENLLRNQKQPGGPLKGGKNLGSFSGGFDIEEDIMGDLC